MSGKSAERDRRIGLVRPLVAIVGRPNVGKSTLFNRLAGRRQAITDDHPGITRDCIAVEVEWNGCRFSLMDTGGFVPFSKDAIESAVREQAELAVEQADIVMLVCDATSGATATDCEVAEVLRRNGVESLPVVNKLDSPGQEEALLGDFFSLGLGTPIPVSAASGRLSGDLLDLLTARFEVPEATSGSGEEADAIRVVLAGRPNVGKSTLMNRLAGSRVSIVHQRPGTTRDTTEIRIHWGGRRFLLMDTAGVRRRRRIDDRVEYYSSLRAARAIEQTDVTLAIIDAAEGVTTQDARIMSKIVDSGSGMAVAINKWDVVDYPKDAGQFANSIRDRYPFLRDFPVVVLSALTGSRVSRCLETAASVFDSRRRRVPTARLNRLLGQVTAKSAARGSGRAVKILYATQQAISPPSFVVFADHPELVSDSYSRNLEKSLREEFDFKGSPLRIFWRSRRDKRKSAN
jgi:GTP-binding protein